MSETTNESDVRARFSFEEQEDRRLALEERRLDLAEREIVVKERGLEDTERRAEEDRGRAEREEWTKHKEAVERENLRHGDLLERIAQALERTAYGAEGRPRTIEDEHGDAR